MFLYSPGARYGSVCNEESPGKWRWFLSILTRRNRKFWSKFNQNGTKLFKMQLIKQIIKSNILPRSIFSLKVCKISVKSKFEVMNFWKFIFTIISHFRPTITVLKINFLAPDQFFFQKIQLIWDDTCFVKISIDQN